MKQRIYSWQWLIGLVLPAVILTGCMGLSEDITPPPDLPTTTPFPTREISPDPTAVPRVENPPDAASGTVDVEILNQMDEEEELSNVQVKLWGFDHMDLVFEDSQLLNSGNQVSFEEVPFLPGRMFFAEVTYRDTTYRSDIAEVNPETDRLTLSVELFGTTSDTSAVTIDRMHIFLDFSLPDTVRVGEILIFSNVGTKTIVPGEGDQTILDIPLPPGYINLQFQDGQLGDRYRLTENGIGDTLEIPPGAGVHQVMMYFELPYDGNELQISQTIQYPLGAVIVMTPSGGVKVRGDLLRDMGLRQIEEGTIHVYLGEQIRAGERLTYRVSGSPSNPDAQAEFSQNPASINLMVGILALSFALLIIWVGFFRRNRAAREDRLTPEQIMDKIIALDNRYADGSLDETFYLNKRRRLKEQLQKAVEGDQQQG